MNGSNNNSPANTGNGLLTYAVSESKNVFPKSKINAFAKKFLLETELIEAKLAEENVKDY